MQGFTLIEVVAVMGMIGLLAGGGHSIYNTVITGRKNRCCGAGCQAG